eukprot:882032-Rhodomonas_salina.2
MSEVDGNTCTKSLRRTHHPRPPFQPSTKGAIVARVDSTVKIDQLKPNRRLVAAYAESRTRCAQYDVVHMIVPGNA